MPDNRWARGEVAGVSLTVDGDPCRCVILDGFRLQSRRFVNQKVAADGTVFTQGLDTAGRNQRFGLRFDFIPGELLREIIDAVNAAVDSMDGFQVTLEDDFHAIDVECTVDGTDWLQYPDQLTNSQVFGAVTMRLRTI